jgi:hypothetical protein
MDCHNKNNSLANRSQVDCGLPNSVLRLPGIHAVKSGLWQYALKLILLSVAILSMVILFIAIHGLNTADCHNPQYT